MHLVVDMQGAQTSSAIRGADRLLLPLIKAIVRHHGENSITLALSGQFPETIGPLTQEFAEHLPAERIGVWYGIGQTQEMHAENNWRRQVSEKLREAYLASLRPDVLLVTSTFDGLTDNSVNSNDGLASHIPTAAIFRGIADSSEPGADSAHELSWSAWHRRRVETVRKSGRLLTFSEHSRQQAIQELGFDAKRIDVIPFACDSAFHDLGLSRNEKQAIGAAYGIHKSFILCQGEIEYLDDLRRMILAFSRLDADQRDQHELAITGTLSQQKISELRQFALANELSADQLRFTGQIPDEDRIRLNNSSALCLFMASRETPSLALLEAMACGAPVIATNTGDAAEIIGLQGALIDPNSDTDFADKLRNALTDPAYRRSLITQGKERAQVHTWDQSAKRAWKSLIALRGNARGSASPLVSVDKTGIFGKRHLKILVVKLDHLGDFILSIPSLAKLRARYPDAQIDAVVGSWNVSFARELGLFRNVHSFDFFKRKSSNRPSAKDDELASLLNALDAYDIAIDLRRQPDSRFLVVRTNAAMKVGYQTFEPEIDDQLDVMLRAYRDASHLRTPLNTTPIAKQILRLVDALPEDINDYVSLPKIAPSTARLAGSVAIFPRAGTEVREWGRIKVTELVDRLLASEGVSKIHVFFVNRGEAAEYAFSESPRLEMHFGLEFSALTGLLSSCNLCIANNSGGIHLASYLGVPVIGIYSGHELAAEWGPQFHNSVAIHRNAECAPCHLGKKSDCIYGNFCLEDISVEDVYRKCMEALLAMPTDMTSVEHTSANLVGLQLNDDALVKELISSLANHLNSDDPQSWLDVSAIIARNHPNYVAVSETQMTNANILNQVLDHRSDSIEWQGFSTPEKSFRWTDGPSSAVHFFLEGNEHVPATGRILLVIDTFRAQRIIAKFNGIYVYDSVRSGKRLLIALQIRNLRFGLNRLELLLPDAAMPGNGDSRQLAIAVRRLKIVVEDEALFGLLRQTSRFKDATMRWG